MYSTVFENKFWKIRKIQNSFVYERIASIFREIKEELFSDLCIQRFSKISFEKSGKYKIHLYMKESLRFFGKSKKN